MDKNLFVLTGKDLLKLSAMMLLGTILFGLTGLVIMIILQWFTRQSYAQDSVDKHGISQIGASRLGGFAVMLCAAGLLGAGTYTGLIDAELGPLGVDYFVWITVSCCMGLGLVEDLKNDYLAPRVRLYSEFAIFGVMVAVTPQFIPLTLGIWGLDAVMALPVIGFVLTVMFCVGFINAVNMADGANGLIPGILTISFSLFYAETGSLVYAALMTSCGLFTIFNVISGRLFLGDTGSYGLGAILVLSGLYFYERGVFSASFLAVLLAYPCIDFLMTLARRSWQGRSIFLPDNDHLHNRLYFHFQKRFRSVTLANSLTGGVIVASSAGVAMMGSLLSWLPVTSELWALVFAVQCIAYLLAFYLAGLGRPISQHVVDV
jgi:UDP-GlcNAc:undecaprenyl-phosphate/decaprenyl-phosphate GlcNAc-1-phosphate transferase